MRSLELAKLAAKIGLQELQSGDLKSRVQQATLIASSLSEMKGAAMKAGQLLSLGLDDYFPPEAIEILSQLQTNALAHPFDEINQIIRSQISPHELKGLTSISSAPIGVASIGQVHKARYKDRDIVLKVQYPNVANSIDSDLKILKTLASSFCLVTRRQMNLDPLFNEFRSLLVQELDYSVEAQFQRQFREKVSTLNDCQTFSYCVPEPISELSTKSVLAMSFEPGLSLRQWLATKPSKTDRDQIAVAVLNLYFHEFFEWGLVQTDPNWGNFLINKKDTHLSLCLLDFGATRKYHRDFIKNYIQLLHFAAANDHTSLRKLAIELAIIDNRESNSAFVAFEDLLKTAIEPFFIGRDGKSYFDFSDPSYNIASQNSAKALARQLVYSPPPYLIIFLHRKLAGVYSILKALDARLDLSPYWQKMTDLSERNK